VCVYTMYIYLKQWDGVVQPADISIITGLLCGDIFLPPSLSLGGAAWGGGGAFTPHREPSLYMMGIHIDAKLRHGDTNGFFLC
jgi:hypothetical protein